MRRSKTVTLTLLGAAALAGGCGQGKAPPGAGAAAQPAAEPVDFSWYDAQGNPVPEQWATDADSNRIPDPYPCDRQGRPWVRDERGELIPLAAAVPATTHPAHTATHSTTTTYRRSPAIVPIFLASSGSGYRSSAGTTGSGYRSFGGTSASAGSVSRGGFGSTGSSMAAGS